MRFCICGVDLSGRHGNTKYCSPGCRPTGASGYVPPSARGRCSGCGEAVAISSTSSDRPYCLTCRRSGRAPSQARHGTSRRYGFGCRCAECVDYKARENRLYVMRNGYRAETRMCEECGDQFSTRADRPTRFCSVSCGNSQRRGSSYRERFVISDEDRLAVYERDGWVCQICSETVARDAHYLDDWAPTLDHVVPRSRGGSDGPDNLRLAHRWCNSVIGDGSFYTDEDLRAVV